MGLFRRWRESIKARKHRREQLKKNSAAQRALATASALTGISVGGWGYSEEQIANTMSVDEVRAVLIEYAEMKAVERAE